MMSHPSWLPPKNSSEPVGHVTARMETNHGFGTPSISVSTQQTTKKFAPVVAPKPKYNPYRPAEGDGDFPPPPPPPADDPGNLPAPPSAFPPPPPPPPDQGIFSNEAKPGAKTLEERRSSLDAEIDSLTSILADLESSSPYKPRTQQGSVASGGSPGATPPVSTPVTSHKRMVIPNQPPLTATKKSASKPAAQPSPIPVTPVGTLKPQPVPAPYAMASTPARPTFNMQVKSAQPTPHFQPPAPQYSSLVPNQTPQPPAQYAPSQPRAPDYGYAPPPVHYAEPNYGYAPLPARYQESTYPGVPSYGGRNGAETSYVLQNTWKPESVHPGRQHPLSDAKKAFVTEPAPALQPSSLQPKSGQAGPNPLPNAPLIRPEDELEHLTKKMLYDMENPPSDEYFVTV